MKDLVVIKGVYLVTEDNLLIDTNLDPLRIVAKDADEVKYIIADIIRRHIYDYK